MVHGVGVLGGRGRWRRTVKRVLAPHFDCKSILYSHYRFLGLLGVLLEPITLILGIASVIALYRMHLTAQLRPWFFVVLGILAVLGIAAGVSHLMRIWALKSFGSSFLSRPLPPHPHVLAHSMGSFLVGTCLPEETARFSHIILAGCVIKADYPWDEIKAKNDLAFKQVRNDVATKDRVPWLAEKAAKAKLLPGFGISGRTGFTLPTQVHTVDNPNKTCEQCQNGTHALVHNYVCNKGHSGVLNPAYASAFWLPWLWGSSSHEYAQWLEQCFVINQQFKNKNWKKVGIFGEKLLKTAWTWTQPGNLDEHIQILVKSHPFGQNATGEWRMAVLQEICSGVAIACIAHQKRRTGWRKNVLFLDPEIVIPWAVDKILTGPEDYVHR